MKARRLAFFAAFLVGAALFSVNAAAVVLSEDALEGDSLSVGGSVRLYDLVLWGGPLASPLAPPDSNPTELAVTALRPMFEWKRSSGFSLVVHDELVSTASTTALGAFGGSLALGRASAVPVWLPLQWQAVDDPTYALRDRIDWAYARYAAGAVTVTAGRQPVSIGRGQIWTPEDLIAPFSPLQIDTEYKPGADALRVDVATSSAFNLVALGAAAKNGNSSLLARFELGTDALRIGAMAGSVRTDVVLGADLFVDLGHGSDFHGAGTITRVTRAERRPWDRRAFSRAVVGVTSELSSTLHVTAEGYFNGAGARSPEQYLEELGGPRVSLGETYTAGRLYAGAAADFAPHPLLHLELSVIANLEDPSAIVAPSALYSVAENVSLIAGAMLGVGERPRYGTGVVPASEFGSYPGLAHLDVKLWF